LVLRWLASPALLENGYSRGVFLGIRWVLDHLFTWIPFPLLYLFVPLVLVWGGRKQWLFWRKPKPWKRRLTDGALGFFAFLSGALFFFLWLWGYNYGRLSVEQSLSLASEPIPVEELGRRVRQEAEELAALRRQIRTDTFALRATDFPARLEPTIRPLVEAALREAGYPVAGRVRGRLLYPKGVFLRFSSAGLYWPFTGEGHIDPGLLELQQPATMAHEMAHGYGFADEGTCSFWAHLACLRSPDPAIQYAGRFDYWRRIAATYRRLEPDAYATWRVDSIDAGMRNDLEAIYANNERYPDLMPRARYVAYDAYLKTQGIKEGMLNYNRVILLVEAWRKRQESESSD
jgi:hypothetical protein